MPKMTKTQVEALSKVINEVTKERMRQIEVKDFHHKQDNSYKNDELVRAAIEYSDASVGGILENQSMWPWPDYPMPKIQEEFGRRNLIKACALLIAEIERRDRLVTKGE